MLAMQGLKRLLGNFSEIHHRAKDKKNYTPESTAGLSELIVHKELMEIYEFMGQLLKIEELPEKNARLLKLTALTSTRRYNKDGKESKASKINRARALDKVFDCLHKIPKNREVFRFSKEMTHLARTLHIVRMESGYELILDTMSKTAEHVPESLHPVTQRPLAAKNKNTIVSRGTFKRAISARCISVPLEKSDTWINLNVWDDHERKKTITNFKKEVAVSRAYNSPYIAKMYLGRQFRCAKTDKIKCTILTPKAMSFSQMMESGELLKQSPTCLNKMITSLLEGLREFNTKHIHQDLKPQNILVVGDRVNGYKTILSDFGLSVPIKKKSEINNTHVADGTAGYQSPEMSAYTKHWDYDKKYKQSKYYESALGYRLCCADLKYFTYERAHEESYSDPKNDIFGLGIILFELLHGRLPAWEDLPIIQENPLLKALLEPRRENRATAEQALAIHNQMCASQENKPVALDALCADFLGLLSVPQSAAADNDDVLNTNKLLQFSATRAQPVKKPQAHAAEVQEVQVQEANESKEPEIRLSVDAKRKML